jgi:hypothetical protein
MPQGDFRIELKFIRTKRIFRDFERHLPIQKPSKKMGVIKLFPHAIQKQFFSAVAISVVFEGGSDTVGVVLAVSFFWHERPTQLIQFRYFRSETIADYSYRFFNGYALFCNGHFKTETSSRLGVR